MKKSNLRILLTTHICAGLGLLLATAGYAQDADDLEGEEVRLEEVMVTARKRQEALQDIPTSASALTREFLDQMNPVENIPLPPLRMLALVLFECMIRLLPLWKWYWLLSPSMKFRLPVPSCLATQKTVRMLLMSRNSNDS